MFHLNGLGWKRQIENYTIHVQFQIQGLSENPKFYVVVPKFFLFLPLIWGNDPIWLIFFQNGLQSPPRIDISLDIWLPIE